MKDRTYEDWDDKKLALLLQEYAEEEGRQLIEENERLQEDPDFIVPEAFSRACQEAIENAAKRDKHKAIWEQVKKSLQRVAVFALVLCLAGGTLFFTVDAFKFYILNTFSSNSETNTRVDVTKDTGNIETVKYIEELWLPNDFTRVFSDISSQSFQLHYFQDSKGKPIELYCIPNFSGTYNIDDEDADEARDITINGNAGRLIVKENIHISWFIPELYLWCDLFCDLSVSEEDAIRVAESVG